VINLKFSQSFPAFWLIGWCVLVGTSLYCRGLIPIDEARYASVAWEMWLNSEFLVPLKNGMAYSDKPPLLFWLIHAGWKIFDVNAYWPRIMPPLFSLGSLWLTAKLANRIWPDTPLMGRLAPTILSGCLVWAVFTPTLMFDMMLTFWVLVALNGVWMAANRDRRGWWLLVGGIGFGMLTKGPVVLLHILPVAVLSPWWSGKSREHRARWYGALTLSVVAGAAIVLAWAIPAGIHGGSAYRDAIFWHQSAGRLSQSFAHMRPWWWYLPSLPIWLLPWSLWWPCWRGLFRTLKNEKPEGIRFLLSWTVVVFLAFSAVSGKQPYYLLPWYPALSMLIAVGLCRHQQVTVGSMTPISLALVSWAVFLLVIPGLQEQLELPGWVGSISPWSSLPLVAIASLLPWLARRGNSASHVLALGWTGLLTIVLTLLFVVRPAAPYYDVTKPSRLIAALQVANIPVAHLGNYDGQYQFPGRLKEPLSILTPDQTSTWAGEHPCGYIVTYPESRAEVRGGEGTYLYPYRGRWLAIVRADQGWPGAAACRSTTDSRVPDRPVMDEIRE
jgi:4-amino-4-deoxy-L-arabinose transferase-like glycosyltransferase